MITLLTDNISSRLQYVADFIFRENWGLHFEILPAHQYNNSGEGVIINYSTQQIPGVSLSIHPDRILFEDIIEKKSPVFGEVNGIPVLFHAAKQTKFPFDIFSATFFLISRYEEYTTDDWDIHGRYKYQNSIAWKHGFLKEPVIHQWLELFRAEINKLYPAFKAQERGFSFLPTFDVDNAFALDWPFPKGMIRKMKFFSGNIFNSYQNLSNQDPYDIFEKIISWHAGKKLYPIFFFLLAGKTHKYDTNNPVRSKKMMDIMSRISTHFETGIHPSYGAEEQNLIRAEREFLETNSGHAVTKSRQHYLRFRLPDTFRMLLDAGIEDEYSMGYGNINGFRASFTNPFYWFDLGKNEKTSLRVHPMSFMDSTAVFHEKLSDDEMLEEMIGLFDKVKKVNGTFITVMHNHFMGNDNPGRQTIYKRFLDYAGSNA